jgi:hypothetical protein
MALWWKKKIYFFGWKFEKNLCIKWEKLINFQNHNFKERKNHGDDTGDYLVITYTLYNMYSYITGHEVSYSNSAVVLSFVN